VNTQLRRHLFSVAAFHRMAEAGILGEDDRVELIAGEIVEMAPVGVRHAGCVRRLNRLLSSGVGNEAIVDIQNPLRLGQHSEPQPDAMLLRFRPDLYAGSHPGPEDVLLVVEVGETPVENDREVKLPLYAEAGAPEVWLVDLGAERVEVYRRPASGGYRDRRVARRGESLSPMALPSLSMAVDTILG
jgi:Uma2 family endonuclease